jgi:hypothetical protein
MFLSYFVKYSHFVVVLMGVFVSGSLGFILAHQHIVNLPGKTHTHALSLSLLHATPYLPLAQGALPPFERGFMLADPSVFTPEIIVASSLRCKAVFARKFIPVILPAHIMQLLQAC